MRAIFRCGQEIEDLRGDVVLYVTQASVQIDNATTEKGRFQTFSDQKRGFLRKVKEVKPRRGGVVLYAAQAEVQTDTEIA